jgi:hypothetical protein
MIAALMGGVSYFVVVYSLGFLLGMIRVLILAPRTGEMGSVLLETPIILGASWIVARWCANMFAVPATVVPRLAMGGVAFALLIAGEIAVSTFVFGRGWQNTAALYQTPPAIVGLAAQVVFGLLPLTQAILDRGSRSN